MPKICTIPAAVAILTVQEVKKHLRIDTADDDAYLQTLIAVATQWIQDECHIQLVSATWRLSLDEFPDARSIRLPMPPLLTVGSITYDNAAGDTQTMPAGDYIVDTDSQPGRVVLSPSASWPGTNGAAANIAITFTAGYGPAADDVPELIKHGAKWIIGHLYENREGAIDRTITEIPLGIQRILDMHRFEEVV